MSDPIITVHQLNYSYTSGSRARPALTDISLEVARGSCTAVIGVTGSGKSTLVQHFNGLLRPSSGEVRVDGVAIGARGGDVMALRRRVGMLFQFPETQLFASTVQADVAFGPQRLGIAPTEVAERVRMALDLVGLPAAQYGARSPFSLSGGQMRRVALAGVLAMQPAVLVLDEPTVGLDADARTEFYNYLQHARHEAGLTVIIVSHDMAEVMALADQVLVLHGGRLVAAEPPRTLFAASKQLRSWGLASPPLGALLELLRAGGVAIPPETASLEEAFLLLRARKRQRRKRNV